MTIYRIKDLIPKYVVKSSVALKIVNHFISQVVKHVLDGHAVGLPHELGYLKIVSKDVPLDLDGKRNAINWKATKELWANNEQAAKDKTLIYYLNEHSDLKYYKFHWSVKNSKWPMKTFYFLRPQRKIKLMLYNSILSGKEYVHKD